MFHVQVLAGGDLAPIFRAGRNDDGARRDVSAAVKPDTIRLSLAHEAAGGFRNHDVSPELLRLRIRARRQLHA